jgi:hypothetical protein
MLVARQLYEQIEQQTAGNESPLPDLIGEMLKVHAAVADRGVLVLLDTLRGQNISVLRIDHPALRLCERSTILPGLSNHDSGYSNLWSIQLKLPGLRVYMTERSALSSGRRNTTKAIAILATWQDDR